MSRAVAKALPLRGDRGVFDAQSSIFPRYLVFQVLVSMVFSLNSNIEAQGSRMQSAFMVYYPSITLDKESIASCKASASS